MRPTFGNTVLPVLALIVGVMIGAFMPKEWRMALGIGENAPSTQAPAGSPEALPTVREVFSELWSELKGLAGDMASKAGSAAGSAVVNAATNPNNPVSNAAAGANAANAVVNAGNAGDPKSAAAIAAERARLAQEAQKWADKPLLIVGAPSGMAIELMMPETQERRIVKLEGVDTDFPGIREQLVKFVGQRAAVVMHPDPTVRIDMSGQVVGRVFVLPATWKPGEPLPGRDDPMARLSLNVAIRKVIMAAK